MLLSIGNHTLKTETVPSLYSAIREAAKMVPNPNPAEVAAGRKTIFDTWLHANPDDNDNTQPGYVEFHKEKCRLTCIYFLH